MKLSINKRLASLLAIISIAISPVCAQKTEVPRTHTFPGIENPAFPYAKPEEVGLSSEKLNRLGDEITAWVANSELVGAELLIIKNGRAIFHEAYGWSDREESKPVERNSIWSIRSMTKPFTAAAVMVLANEGKLSVNDKVIDFIPEFAGDPRTTIGHLISHTSGYQDVYFHTLPFHETLKDFVMDWATMKPTGTFGEYEYANANFAAAGYIIESVSGLPIQEFMENEIFTPLGLENTSTYFSKDPGWRSRMNDAWYWWDADALQSKVRFKNDSLPYPYQLYNAGAGIYSTAIDYGIFSSVFLNEGITEGKRLLKKETVEAMIRPHGKKNGDPRYGYGWMLSSGGEENKGVVIHHAGADGTVAYIYPEENVIAVFMAQTRGGNHGNAIPEWLSMLGIVNSPVGGETVKFENFKHPILDLPIEKAKSLVGHYLGEFRNKKNNFDVYMAGNNLIANAFVLGEKSAFWVRDLAFLGEDKFVPGLHDEKKWKWVTPSRLIRFQSDSSGVMAVEVIVNEQPVFRGKKVAPLLIETEERKLRNKKSIDNIIAESINEEGIEAALTLARDLYTARPDSIIFSHSMMRNLGIRYDSYGQFREAIAVHKINLNNYPENLFCYFDLAMAYLYENDFKKAHEYYSKGMEIAKKQGDPKFESLKKITQMLDNKLKSSAVNKE